MRRPDIENQAAVNKELLERTSKQQETLRAFVEEQRGSNMATHIMMLLVGLLAILASAPFCVWREADKFGARTARARVCEVVGRMDMVLGMAAAVLSFFVVDALSSGRATKLLGKLWWAPGSSKPKGV